MITRNKCHICLEDKVNLPSYNKKQCCSSKAYICNNCWNTILESKDIEKCPICKGGLPVIEDVIVEINPQVVEIRHGRNPTLLMESHLECRFILTMFGALFLFTLEGYIVFNLCLFFSVSSIEEQNDTLMEIIPYPLFWIIQPLIGVATTICLLGIYYNSCYKCFH